jgi:hypothetical protein
VSLARSTETPKTAVPEKSRDAFSTAETFPKINDKLNTADLAGKALGVNVVRAGLDEPLTEAVAVGQRVALSYVFKVGVVTGSVIEK